MSLDLDEGDEELANETPAERRRRARAATKSAERKSKPAAPSRSASDRVDTELLSRLDRTFDRIAKALDARGDEELATVIREDSGAMGQGLVSLTHSVTPLRGPLLMLLNLVEPVLAFGRVGRILYYRWVQRRWARTQEEESSPVAPTP